MPWLIKPRHRTLIAFASYHELAINRKSRIFPGLVSLYIAEIISGFEEATN
ncbi:MAG: hypothetical protein WA816_06805 [Bacteroidales bacterium]